MGNAFELKLKNGQIGESLISHWLRSKGWNVLPVYEMEVNHGKGPRLFSAQSQIVAPDAIAFKGEKVMWIEVKHKTAFTEYRIKGTFQTGIDLRHYMEYIKISELNEWPLWILFFHAGGTAKDSAPSPAGLYGGEIRYLMSCEDHRSEKHGHTGMVYWNEQDLKKLATYDEVVCSVFEQAKLF